MSTNQIGVVETARRLGGYGWVEARLFEVTGSWVPLTDEPAAKVVLATHSRRFGWRAQMWASARPKLWDQPDEHPARDDHEAMVGFVAGADTTTDRLAALYRMAMPRLLAAYQAHLEIANPLSDGATARWLRIAIGDLSIDRAEGEALLAIR